MKEDDGRNEAQGKGREGKGRDWMEEEEGHGKLIGHSSPRLTNKELY